AADHAGARTEQPRADRVSASSEGKVLDDLRVRGGNDEDGQPRGEREEDRQVLVLPEVLERLFRTVSGRAEPVGAEADPGEESCQRNVLEELGILDVLGTAEQGALESLPSRRRQRRL